MYLCDLIHTDCPYCPFRNFSQCRMNSKEDIVSELQNMKDQIESALSQIEEKEE